MGEELHNFVICADDHIYDSLGSLTNSTIHPTQRRASYRELLSAFMKGIDEWIKKHQPELPPHLHPKFTCFELLGETTTALDMINIINEKSDKRRLENDNRILLEQIEKLNISLKE